MFARIDVKIALATVVLAISLCPRLQAMDRWSALSQIESGDDDRAMGAAGEVSRFQIKPELWQRYAPAGSNWTNAEQALFVAKEAMRDRSAAFERSAHRPPTDSEFFILWNAPAEINHPSKAVLGRAERFCNLIDCK